MEMLLEAMRALQGMSAPLSREDRERLLGYIGQWIESASDEVLMKVAGELDESPNYKEVLYKELSKMKDQDWRDLGAPGRERMLKRIWPGLERTRAGRSFIAMSAVSSLRDTLKNITKFL
jgi:hypothetical protein